MVDTVIVDPLQSVSLSLATASWVQLGVAAFGVSFFAFALALVWLCRTNRKGLPPNAKLPPVYKTGLPVIGPFLAFIADPLGCISRARGELGSVFTINMAHMKTTVLIGSEAHKPFFEADDDDLDQAPVYRFMVPIFGKGVLYDAPLPKRKQQLRLLGKCLKPSDLRLYPSKIGHEAQMFFQAFGEKQEVDILHKMASLTILTASATLLGREVRENMFENVSRLFSQMDAGISPLSVVAPTLPTPAHRARDRAHKEMIALFAKVIRDRRARQEAEGSAYKKEQDMLQMLIDANYKPETPGAQPSPIPDHEIAGMLVAALFAGQHTSSITVSWTLMFLVNDHRNGGPWLKKVLQELREVEPSPGSFARGDVPHSSINNMTILHSCIKESLRMHPPLIMLMRQVVNNPLEVCGFHVPVGHTVMVSNAVAMRLPEVFPRPDTWDPSRWVDFDPRAHPPYSFIGFGAGIHTCMGESFAFMQLRTILAVMLSTFEVEMLGPMPVPDYEAIVVMPKGKNMIRFTRLKTTDGDAPVVRKAPSESSATDPKPIDMYLDAGDAGQAFTKAEVAKHNKRDDLWLIVNNKVYDVTTYLPVHQGGDAILKYAGKEATAAVYGPQHPQMVGTILNRYHIGHIVD